ncbi:putative multimer resolution protein [[Actinomadura] parvosata subsp. kistnae]|uniref:Core-binding (CB) domain-containing protein n=1 Tax=[Actinomadura] parvosata subsp. kistnae TaxID=1909395 RepID=A0A1U9ZWY5_9ACTN|nr:hypothetical protein [Nonomuraea sp. ATCC 55076]AQZ62452.1 hypothetical protein BKM31_14165 [Nonomuraea sp. ATCC 55076]SPL88687.1 putative multimer resolution protein [Actinomadura parvosata subsp. kistnae]
METFLGSPGAATTRAGYARTLARLTAATGPRHPVAELDCGDYAAVMAAWDSAAPATSNRHPSALISFTTWAQRQDLPATNPGPPPAPPQDHPSRRPRHPRHRVIFAQQDVGCAVDEAPIYQAVSVTGLRRARCRDI